MSAEAPPAVVGSGDGTVEPTAPPAGGAFRPDDGTPGQPEVPGVESATAGNGAGMTMLDSPEAAERADPGPTAAGRPDAAVPDGYDGVLPNGEVRLESVPVDAPLEAAVDAPPGAGVAADGAPEDSAPADAADPVDPAYAVEGHLARGAEPETADGPLDGRVTDAAYLVDETGPDGPPVDTATPGSLAAVVAEHLAGPAPGGDGGGDRAQAAEAVLAVLKASGWSDATETQELRSEVERLRELLDLVVRDHRARVATAASGQDQQAHWLVPLLRAAHGVSFGTLGAKVHLRTAVQDVPPDVLASAGLRIDDYGAAAEPDGYH